MIERKDADGIRVLKLAHGKVSAMDLELGEAFIAEITAAMDPAVKAVILTGSGSSFSAGVDLFRLIKDGPDYGRRFLPVLDEFLRAALTFPKPLVAAVNGHAIAGGCILAATCDHRIMVEGNGRIGRSGKIRVFRPHELSADVMMASACLPHMFKAVEIDGEHYWDGGYMGNPAMFPLIYNCRSSDIVLIEINQIRIEKLPTTARDIIERMSDISFNSTMMREMRAISLVTSLIEQHRLTGRTQLRPIHFHMIEAAEDMQKFSSSSKFNCDLDFLLELHDIGRRAADRWLANHFRTVGTDSSVDLHSLFF